MLKLKKLNLLLIITEKFMAKFFLLPPVYLTVLSLRSSFVFSSLDFNKLHNAYGIRHEGPRYYSICVTPCNFVSFVGTEFTCINIKISPPCTNAIYKSNINCKNTMYNKFLLRKSTA